MTSFVLCFLHCIALLDRSGLATISNERFFEEYLCFFAVLSELYVDCIVCDKQRLDAKGVCIVSENVFNSSMLSESFPVTV